MDQSPAAFFDKADATDTGDRGATGFRGFGDFSVNYLLLTGSGGGGENLLPTCVLCHVSRCTVCASFAFTSYSLFLPAFLTEFHWGRGAAALPFSLAMVCWGAMQPVAGALADRRGTRPVILVGLLMSALGFFTMGIAQSLWQVALGFGVLLGTATSACGSLMWA